MCIVLCLGFQPTVCRYLGLALRVGSILDNPYESGYDMPSALTVPLKGCTDQCTLAILLVFSRGEETG
jgi:hypothetical protein